MNEDIGLLCTDDFRAFTVIEFQTAFGDYWGQHLPLAHANKKISPNQRTP